MISKSPKVSVVMITYGHESYIQEAIDGVLIQKCDFEIELIIANDNSPDDTDEVITSFLAKKLTPKNIQIRYYCHDQNIGMSNNFTWALRQAKGEYVSLCEGDDYWTDPLKLKKQVDFLEANPDYVMCFTDRYFLNFERGEIVKTPFHYNENQKKFTRRNINIFAPTLTRVFRNIGVPNYKNIGLNDTIHLTWLANYGKMMYFREKTGVYRYNGVGAGVFSSLKQSDKFKHRIRSYYHAKYVTKDSITRTRLNLSASILGLQLWLKTYPEPDVAIQGVKFPKCTLRIMKTNSLVLVRIYNSMLVRISRLISILFVKYQD